MISFLTLHNIAAQRGDGLRPELVRLLERWGCSENDHTSPIQVKSGDRLTALSSPDLTRYDSDLSHQGLLCASRPTVDDRQPQLLGASDR
jgi:hypothetical protein